MTLLLVDGFYSPLKLDRNGFDRGLLLSIWDTILSKIHVEYIHNSIIKIERITKSCVLLTILPSYNRTRGR